MGLRSIDEVVQKEIINDLTKALKSLEDDVLDRYMAMGGRKRTLPSLHGVIGGKNNTYVDAVRGQFPDPKTFQSLWIEGLMTELDGRPHTSAARLVRYLKDNKFREYTLLFLERNFYRNHLERTRMKPETALWQVWFGENKMVWGLLIAPRFWKGEWINDKSEIRRAKYGYWTVGHVLEVGIIDPERDKPVQFNNLEQFIIFYRSVLKRMSVSEYEKEIAELYTLYLENSNDPTLEPFLIPEMRYRGLEKKHEFRLDFTILNSHTMEYVGFEISPFSTHGAISKVKEKNLKEINAEGAAKWAKEMTKRNSYFAEYGIQTVTFTDPELKDLSACFENMRNYLTKRSAKPADLKKSLKKLLR